MAHTYMVYPTMNLITQYGLSGLVLDLGLGVDFILNMPGHGTYMVYPTIDLMTEWTSARFRVGVEFILQNVVTPYTYVPV